MARKEDKAGGNALKTEVKQILAKARGDAAREEHARQETAKR
jgi:hypothetical protein